MSTSKKNAASQKRRTGEFHLRRSSEAIQSFMLAEYSALTDILIENEQATDRRLELFLTIFGASIGALVLALQIAPDITTFYLWAFVLLATVRLLGASVLWKLNSRIVTYVEYSRAINAVKIVFANLDGEAAQHIYLLLRDDLYHPAPWQPNWGPRKALAYWLMPVEGMHRFVVAINTLLSFCVITALMRYMDGVSILNLPLTTAFIAGGLVGFGHYIAQTGASKSWISVRIGEGKQAIAELTALKDCGDCHESSESFYTCQSSV